MFPLVEQNAGAFLYLGPHLREDREVVLTAVHGWGGALPFASPYLQMDRQLKRAAAQQVGLRGLGMTRYQRENKIRGKDLHVWLTDARSKRRGKSGKRQICFDCHLPECRCDERQRLRQSRFVELASKFDELSRKQHCEVQSLQKKLGVPKLPEPKKEEVPLSRKSLREIVQTMVLRSSRRLCLYRRPVAAFSDNWSGRAKHLCDFFACLNWEDAAASQNEKILARVWKRAEKSAQKARHERKRRDQGRAHRWCGFHYKERARGSKVCRQRRAEAYASREMLELQVEIAKSCF